MIYRRVSHDHSVSVAVCRGIALFLSSDVLRVYLGTDVELKYSAFIIKLMMHDILKTL